MQREISPDQILQIGFGFWASKTLLSAVELELFSLLADGPKTGIDLQRATGLHPRGTYDFLDTLVALGLLQRDGRGETGKYANTPSTARYLVRQSPQYIGGILEMANARLYRFWADLTPALKTGKPQNEIKETGKSMFGELYADPARLEQFMDAMSGISMGNFTAFAEKFDFPNTRPWRISVARQGSFHRWSQRAIRICNAGPAISPRCGRSRNAGCESEISMARSSPRRSTSSRTNFPKQMSSQWE